MGVAVDLIADSADRLRSTDTADGGKNGHIVLPQAVRVAVPGLSNNFVDIIKQSSLAFTLGVTEIMAVAKMEGSTNLRFLESFTAVMIVYWLIVTVFNYLQKLLERWLSRMY